MSTVPLASIEASIYSVLYWHENYIHIQQPPTKTCHCSYGTDVEEDQNDGPNNNLLSDGEGQREDRPLPTRTPKDRRLENQPKQVASRRTTRSLASQSNSSHE